MTGFRVVLADDDGPVRDRLERALRAGGYQVRVAADGAEALYCVDTYHPDAAILGVQIRVVDGLQVCRSLRRAGNDVPILLLTHRAGVHDRIQGLDAGADDYVAKPFVVEELLARLRALLRRYRGGEGVSSATLLRYADLTLDRDTRRASRGKHSVGLTRTEFAVLELFMANPGRVLTRAQVFRHVWGFDAPGSNNVDVYVGYVRRKLEAGGHPRLLYTQRGVGFILQSRAGEAP